MSEHESTLGASSDTKVRPRATPSTLYACSARISPAERHRGSERSQRRDLTTGGARIVAQKLELLRKTYIQGLYEGQYKVSVLACLISLQTHAHLFQIHSMKQASTSRRPAHVQHPPKSRNCSITGPLGGRVAARGRYHHLLLSSTTPTHFSRLRPTTTPSKAPRTTRQPAPSETRHGSTRRLRAMRSI